MPVLPAYFQYLSPYIYVLYFLLRLLPPEGRGGGAVNYNARSVNFVNT